MVNDLNCYLNTNFHVLTIKRSGDTAPIVLKQWITIENNRKCRNIDNKINFTFGTDI